VAKRSRHRGADLVGGSEEAVCCYLLTSTIVLHWSREHGPGYFLQKPDSLACVSLTLIM